MKQVSFKTKVFGKGNEIFGNEKNFMKWLNTPNIVMGNKKPIIYRWNIIYDELIRIEQGLHI